MIAGRKTERKEKKERKKERRKEMEIHFQVCEMGIMYERIRETLRLKRKKKNLGKLFSGFHLLLARLSDRPRHRRHVSKSPSSSSWPVPVLQELLLLHGTSPPDKDGAKDGRVKGTIGNRACEREWARAGENRSEGFSRF